MFYCEACRVEQEWPNSISQSFGQCEMCRESAVCWNRSSSSLPDSKSYKEYLKKLAEDNAKIEHRRLESIALSAWKEFDGANSETKEHYLNLVNFITKLYKEK